MSTKKTVSYASFNLFNLQLEGLKMYNNKPWTKKQYDSKIIWASNKILEIDADVIGFQELWHQDALTEVFNTENLKGKYELIIPENHTGEKIVCAAAVRKDIKVIDRTWIEKFPEKFKMNSKGGDKQTLCIYTRRWLNINLYVYFKNRTKYSSKSTKNIV